MGIPANRAIFQGYSRVRFIQIACQWRVRPGLSGFGRKWISINFPREAGNAMHLLLDLFASVINGLPGRLHIVARVFLYAVPRIAAPSDGRYKGQHA